MLLQSWHLCLFVKTRFYFIIRLSALWTIILLMSFYATHYIILQLVAFNILIIIMLLVVQLQGKKRLNFMVAACSLKLASTFLKRIKEPFNIRLQIVTQIVS